jgi:membrane-associated phospholipid phosphatase
MLNFARQQFLYLFQSLLNYQKINFLTSLLLVLVGVLLPFLIFGMLAEEVWKNEGGFSWDIPILLAVHQMAQPSINTFAIYSTKLGVFWGVVPIAIAIAVLLCVKHQWRRLTYFLSVLIGSAIINRTVKPLLHRVRPHLWLSPTPELDYGFPSGHAMASMTLVTAVVILTWKTPYRKWSLSFGSLFVLLIAWSRLYLGVHFPSDILAAWTVSIAWTIAVSLLLKANKLD